MRGLIGATVLAALEQKRGRLMRDILAGGYVGGTSTGGLLTGCIAAGIPMSDVVRVYTEAGPQKVFQPTNTAERNINMLIHGGYKFNNQVLHEVVVATLGSNAKMTLNDSPIDICICCGDTLNKQWFFRKGDPETGGCLLADVMTATACAATYQAFFSVNVPGQGNIPMCDGGDACMADPTFQVCRNAFSGPDGVPVPSAIIIRLGTGKYTPPKRPDPPDGILAVISQVTNSLVDNSEGESVMITKMLWPAVPFYDVDVVLPVAYDEADVSPATIASLSALGTQLSAQVNWDNILG